MQSETKKLGSTGIARLTIVEAVLHKDTEFFGKMDPYFKIFFRNFEMTSKINYQGGKSPKWNETFQIHVKNKQEVIRFEVYDEEKNRDDIMVGERELKMENFIDEAHKNKWFTLFYKGKPKGEIHIKCDFMGM